MNNIQKSCLAETGRWQKLLGVVMMVFTVLIALFGIFFCVLGIVSKGAFLEEESDIFGTVMGVAIGVMYLLIAILYYFFAIYLLRSAKAFKAYVDSDNDADFTEGLRNTKSFFRLSGILAIISVCALGLALVGAAVAAIVVL